MIHFRHMSVALILILILATACTGSYRAPVNDVAGGPRHLYDGRMHRVNAGETLYAIAWIYNADYRLLAQINEVTAPYTIYTGQMLSVDTRGHTLKPPPAPPPEVRVSPAPPPARVSRSANNNTPASTQGATPSVSPPRAAPSVAPAPRPAEAPRVASGSGPIASWQWPATGTVVGRFTSANSASPGLDIGGQRNDPIL